MKCLPSTGYRSGGLARVPVGHRRRAEPLLLAAAEARGEPGENEVSSPKHVFVRIWKSESLKNVDI